MYKRQGRITFDTVPLDTSRSLSNIFTGRTIARAIIQIGTHLEAQYAVTPDAGITITFAFRTDVQTTDPLGLEGTVTSQQATINYLMSDSTTAYPRTALYSQKVLDRDALKGEVREPAVVDVVVNSTTGNLDVTKRDEHGVETTTSQPEPGASLRLVFNATLSHYIADTDNTSREAGTSLSPVFTISSATAGKFDVRVDWEVASGDRTRIRLDEENVSEVGMVPAPLLRASTAYTGSATQGVTIHSVDVFGQPGTGTNSPTIPLGYVRLVQARNSSNQVEFYLDYLTNPCLLYTSPSPRD